MSFQATAWASKVKTGSPAAKAVLMMIANYMAPHEDEADGFLCGYPGQDIIAEESEMSVRATRDHVAALVRRGLIQRKKRYKWDGTRTSDWYRVPIKTDGSVAQFPAVEEAGSTKEWPQIGLPAESAPSRLPADERSDYRQLVAGNKGEDQLGNLHKTPTSSYVGADSDEKPKTQQRKRATRIPGDFTVTAEMVAWAKENAQDVDGRYETSQFVDYWTGRGGAVASKLDWVAAWRTWMRKAQKDSTSRGTSGFSTANGYKPFRNPGNASAYQGAF